MIKSIFTTNIQEDIYLTVSFFFFYLVQLKKNIYFIICNINLN